MKIFNIKVFKNLEYVSLQDGSNNIEPTKPMKPVKNPIPMLMYNASKNIEFSSPAFFVSTGCSAGSSP